MICSLPESVNVLSLEYLGGVSGVNRVLLRLEHLFEQDEGQEEARVDLAGLFSTFDVRMVEEMALGGNVPLSQVPQRRPKNMRH